MSSNLRPPTRADKGSRITSIAELKKAIKNIAVLSSDRYISSTAVSVFIDEFEASLRERIAECERQATLCKQNELYHDSGTFLKLVEELREILGEGVK